MSYYDFLLHSKSTYCLNGSLQGLYKKLVFPFCLSCASNCLWCLKQINCLYIISKINNFICLKNIPSFLTGKKLISIFQWEENNVRVCSFLCIVYCIPHIAVKYLDLLLHAQCSEFKYLHWGWLSWRSLFCSVPFSKFMTLPWTQNDGFLIFSSPCFAYSFHHSMLQNICKLEIVFT